MLTVTITGTKTNYANETVVRAETDQVAYWIVPVGARVQVQAVVRPGAGLYSAAQERFATIVDDQGAVAGNIRAATDAGLFASRWNRPGAALPAFIHGD